MSNLSFKQIKLTVYYITNDKDNNKYYFYVVVKNYSKSEGMYIYHNFFQLDKE